MLFSTEPGENTHTHTHTNHKKTKHPREGTHFHNIKIPLNAKPRNPGCNRLVFSPTPGVSMTFQLEAPSSSAISAASKSPSNFRKSLRTFSALASPKALRRAFSAAKTHQPMVVGRRDGCQPTEIGLLFHPVKFPLHVQ